MRFTAILLASAFAFLANAQSTTSTPTTLSTATTTYSESAEQSSMVACIDACDAGDVSCQAKCIAVPNPNVSQANATNQCVADCPQGNGTEADTLNYENCVEACIGQYYFTTTGTPATATGAASGTGTTSGATASVTGTASRSSNSATGTASSSASGTGSAAASSSSKAAGETLHVVGPAVGLLGFMAAFLAL